MPNLDIRTTLSIIPPDSKKAPEILVVTRGASAELLFDFMEYSYLIDSEDVFKYIDQITFLFEQNNNIWYYDLLDEKGAYNPKFAYDSDRMCFSLLLDSEDTMLFEPTTEFNPAMFEIAIKANTEFITVQGQDSVIIEPKKPIIVVDSLYSKAKIK